MNVSIIGNGYVGLVTGVALAHASHRVVCVGRNQEKVNAINAGKAPFFEPGLEKLLRQVIGRKRLTASTEFAESVVSSDVTIIAVGTPTAGGAIDLSQVKEVAEKIGKAIADKKTYHVVAVKSTVVPGTTEAIVWPILAKASSKDAKELGLCMNPEFLREGNAVEDALHPDRIVIGSMDKKAATVYAKLFAQNTCPTFFVNLATAEMSKYVSNVLLATLVSFSNEIGNLAVRIPGVDVVDVWRAVHADRRWSPAPGIIHYLFTGCGYGGSCFPKDTKALLRFASEKGMGMPMLRNTISTNDAQPNKLIELLTMALGELQGKRVAVLGLSFKPNTDDTRESPALKLIQSLHNQGAQVVCHDPQVRELAVLRELGVKQEKTYESSLKSADAAVLVTAWEAYRKIIPEEFIHLMKTPIIIDGRRIYDPKKFIEAGIDYRAVGRAS